MLHLRFGQKIHDHHEDDVGTEQGVSTTFKELPESVRKGDRILLSDGQIALRVLSARGTEVITQVENGGRLGQHQGINLPGVKLRIPSLTKRPQGPAFCLDIGANYIALSFVRTAADVRAAKAAIARAGKNVPVIAKLEKPEAIENLDAILEVADGVMVARGDLGVEMNPEQVPVVQKKIILKARNALVPVITATQMLDSMEKNPRPTRAEASDVANAIFDGSDALMLSGETAAGLYPLEAVSMMDRIIREAEASVTMLPRPERTGNCRSMKPSPKPSATPLKNCTCALSPCSPKPAPPPAWFQNTVRARPSSLSPPSEKRAAAWAFSGACNLAASNASPILIYSQKPPKPASSKKAWSKTATSSAW